jgi:hypothetical protein
MGSVGVAGGGGSGFASPINEVTTSLHHLLCPKIPPQISQAIGFLLSEKMSQSAKLHFSGVER